MEHAADASALRGQLGAGSTFGTWRWLGIVLDFGCIGERTCRQLHLLGGSRTQSRQERMFGGVERGFTLWHGCRQIQHMPGTQDRRSPASLRVSSLIALVLQVPVFVRAGAILPKKMRSFLPALKCTLVACLAFSREASPEFPDNGFRPVARIN